MFQDVVSTLSRFGLKDKDAKIYLCLLHFKEGLHVHELVTQTKIKRSTVDLILKRLTGDGYVSRIKVGNRYKYFAESPEALLFRQEEAVSDFRDLLPLLSKLGSTQGETEIKFFEGAAGIRKAYEDVLFRLKFAKGEARSYLSFSSGAHITKIFPDIQKTFIDKRIKTGIWYKAIAPESSRRVREWTNDPQSRRAVKYFDEKRFPFKVTMDIYADSLMIYSPVKPVGGVIIRNEKIASSLRSLFYLLWDLLPEKE